MTDGRLDPALTSKFAQVALAHVRREYPNKLDHVIGGADDLRSPMALHPVFYGSFDWHSCVHGYWLLARLLRRMPQLPEASQVRALFDAQLTSEKVAVETAYLAQPLRSTFERPYGWAWLLMLAAELERLAPVEGAHWSEAVRPLAQAFAERFKAFLPKATYPVRVGTHYNSAFAIRLGLDYARVVRDGSLEQALVAKARSWFAGDKDCQAWEPGGDDFLSSALIEAECMRAVLDAAAFAQWIDAFLPRIARREPATLFTPAEVSDRSDGKIAHLDGLNLSRAWCWRSLSNAWNADDPRREIVLEAAEAHLAASLPYVAGDYMGEHWLATYAILALDRE